jgi:hypothetical protein
MTVCELYDLKKSTFCCFDILDFGNLEFGERAPHRRGARLCARFPYIEAERDASNSGSVVTVDREL